MLGRSGFEEYGLAGHGDPHRILLKALADKDDGYRHRMRPADIIAQNLSERRNRPAAGLSRRIAVLVRKIVRFELNHHRLKPMGFLRTG